jgi:hypothetical protein
MTPVHIEWPIFPEYVLGGAADMSVGAAIFVEHAGLFARECGADFLRYLSRDPSDGRTGAWEAVR